MDETVEAAAKAGADAPVTKVEAEPALPQGVEHAGRPHALHQDVRRLRADSEAIRKAFESGEFPYKTRLSEKVYLRHMELL
ncbi:MAG: polyphosphate kinase 2, partial [Alphaproteobacteria bacterium]|nr:polyphosphate kinase 2 [Alphaproteobacteria bacterium]